MFFNHAIFLSLLFAYSFKTSDAGEYRNYWLLYLTNSYREFLSEYNNSVEYNYKNIFIAFAINNIIEWIIIGRLTTEWGWVKCLFMEWLPHFLFILCSYSYNQQTYYISPNRGVSCNSIHFESVIQTVLINNFKNSYLTHTEAEALTEMLAHGVSYNCQAWRFCRSSLFCNSGR